jgi:hypothetical protein
MSEVTVRGARVSSSHAKVGDKLAAWESAAAHHWKMAIKIDKETNQIEERNEERRTERARARAK